MRESVKTVNHPLVVGIIVAAMGFGYFALLGTADYPEPGPHVSYDMQTWRDVDNIETRYEEIAPLEPNVANPQALALDGQGRIYIAGENAILVYENDQETDRIAIDGTPKCLTVDDDGKKFIGYSDHVEVLTADGKVEQVWDTLPRAFITSIDIQDEHVYVADAGNRVVIHYDKGGAELGRIGKLDEKNDIPGIEVPSPYLDLAVNPDGYLWVVNPGRLGLERYRSDGSIVTSWYKPELSLQGFSGCCNPTHVAFAKDGRLITAEKGLVRLKVYDVTSGEFEELIAGSRLFPREQSLRDILVDGSNRILVLDPRTDTVRIFDEKEHENG
jgi:DNA-binding beta-propeller fold protein YncE